MSQIAQKIQKPCRTAGWLLLVAIVAASVSPIAFRPLSGFAPGFERVTAFLALGLLFGVGYFRNWVLVLSVLTVGAFAIETLQLLTPDRHATLLDALLKASGSTVGALAGRFVMIPGLRWWPSANGRSAAQFVKCWPIRKDASRLVPKPNREFSV